MSVIKTHKVNLHGKLKDYHIRLKPLNGEHLPLLYKWNSDPEVTFWCESCDGVNDEETVRDIYSYVSPIAYCFLLEVDGKPIGDCWLQL